MNRASMILALTALLLCQCGYGYSEGDRAGVVTKFSYKGLVWKSWEGTMNLGGLKTQSDSNGSESIVANTWDFHVARQDVVDQIEAALRSGRPITVHYEEWAMGPISQDSSYDVTGVTVSP